MKELVFDDSDGIEVLRYADPYEPQLNRGVEFTVYDAWLGGEHGPHIFLLYAKDGWSYHSQEDTLEGATDQALKALIAMRHNKKKYERSLPTMRSWLTDNPEVTFTKQDANGAGFCVLGVNQFFSTYGWSDQVSAEDALICLRAGDEKVGMVAYQVFKNL